MISGTEKTQEDTASCSLGLRHLITKLYTYLIAYAKENWVVNGSLPIGGAWLSRIIRSGELWVAEDSKGSLS